MNGYKFLACMLCSSLFILWKITGNEYHPHFRVTVIENDARITSLDQTRTVKSSRTWSVDQLQFLFLNVSQYFVHPRLGAISRGENIFVEVVGDFDLAQNETLEFDVQSDDGFRLAVDSKTLSSFTTFRGRASTIAQETLGSGTHHLHLSYYQGDGPLGLEARYRVLPNGTWNILGNDIPGVHFLELDTLQSGGQ